MRSRRSPDERGSILIMAVIVVSFLSVIGLGLIAFSLSRSTYAAVQLDRLKALYLAEAGLAKALWELRYDIDSSGRGPGTLARTRLGDGYFWTAHDFQTSTITATGEVNGIRRTGQIEYSVL